ncbi:MAG: succinyldiaminopimelate transaminase [Gammaproteobacteria bacterium SG8_47]|nr:MAG: succinyldiaminopimelate transaminase [Gammaproteobacteria bacterium SG8_47]
MHQWLTRLQPYPFERLNSLKHGCTPPPDRPHIALSIGEPRHEPPHFVVEALIAHLHGLSSYPTTRGSDALRQAIAEWVSERFGLPADTLSAAEHVLPVNGTREALFAFAQAVVNSSSNALVLMPNPFYQIYEGAALLAGAEPYFLNAFEENGFMPDLDAVADGVWERCQLIYLCSPGNPSGAVMPVQTLQRIIELADRYDFVIASDECYSELYFDETQPPAGLLQAAAAMGRTDYARCVVFHSLSKRSNLPGMRSGFVAGDADIIRAFFQYRTYHGCSMPPHHQAASISAWRDEDHVRANRKLYTEKFAAVMEILGPVMDVKLPQAGFYLWPRTPIEDERFARELYARQNVTVLPGSYLSRPAHGQNPGAGRVRMALVAELEQCVEAAHRIREFVETL